MAEWPNAVVLKTIEPKGSEGSNPSLSATFILIANFWIQFVLFQQVFHIEGLLEHSEIHTIP